MNDRFCFALPSGYDWEVKTFVRQVKTKSWANKYKNKLSRYADLFTRANRDDAHIVGAMLQAAYGYNIGGQVHSKLKQDDFEKIRLNIIGAVYR